MVWSFWGIWICGQRYAKKTFPARNGERNSLEFRKIMFGEIMPSDGNDTWFTSKIRGI